VATKGVAIRPDEAGAVAAALQNPDKL
jgi:hypothetical protein